MIKETVTVFTKVILDIRRALSSHQLNWQCPLLTQSGLWSAFLRLFFWSPSWLALSML